MASKRAHSVTRQLHALFSEGVTAGLTDAELLERFVSRNEEAAQLAFAGLVARHGPMVLGVCRQTLRDAHTAEDAFQAVFLILARKARSLYPGASLAPWLQRVAWRTASRLREQTSVRAFHEQEAAKRVTNVVADRPWDDFAEVMHAEIGRLPAHYRMPLVLCYLEGLSAEQAARQLGWPAGTVRSRLARGRERLRLRLIRRGVAPSTAALIAALSSGTARAVPGALANVTSRAAATLGAGNGLAELVPASILTLTEGVLQTMAMTKWKISGLALLASILLASGALVSAQAPSPSPNLSDADRLRAVEAKLDRLLQALDAAASPNGAGRTQPSGVDPEVPYGGTRTSMVPATIEYELRVWRDGIPMTAGSVRLKAQAGQMTQFRMPEGTVQLRFVPRQDPGPMPPAEPELDRTGVFSSPAAGPMRAGKRVDVRGPRGSGPRGLPSAGTDPN